MVLVWRITDDLPNSPNFPPAKLSCYTVLNNIVCVIILLMQLLILLTELV